MHTSYRNNQPGQHKPIPREATQPRLEPAPFRIISHCKLVRRASFETLTGQHEPNVESFQLHSKLCGTLFILQFVAEQLPIVVQLRTVGNSASGFQLTHYGGNTTELYANAYQRIFGHSFYKVSNTNPLSELHIFGKPALTPSIRITVDTRKSTMDVISVQCP